MVKLKHKIKRDLIKGGKKLINWNPTSKSTVRHYFTKKTKEMVLKYQKGKCAVNRCNVRRFLEFDHIRNRGDNSFSNCQALCPFHHRAKTQRDKTKLQIEKQHKLYQT